MSMQQDTEDHIVDDNSSNDALFQPSCLLNVLSHFSSPRHLCHALSVNQLWKSVAEMPALWEDLYTRLHGLPYPYERVTSPIKQFKRLAALRNLDAGSRTKLGFKARAACYCPASKQLVLLDNALNLYFWSPDTGTTVMKRMVNADVDQAAEKPLLAVCGTGRAIAGGSDGTLQVWDCLTHQHLFSLARHPSSIMDVAADGDLVASTCGKELRLWDLAARKCSHTRPHNSPIDLADIAALGSPRVAVSSPHQLAVVMNHHFPPSNTIEVLSTAPDTLGQRIICLSANATVDVRMRGHSLLVASCFQSRMLSAASLAADRFYTVLVTSWDMRTWRSTRLFTPRMRVAHGAAAMRDLPLLHPTGDLLLCGLLADDAASRMPFCCIRAWQLGAGQQGQGQAQQQEGDGGGGSSGVVRVASLSPRKQARPAGSTAAGAAGASEEASSSSGAGSSGSAGAAAAAPQPSSVMLVVGEEDRQAMISVVEDTQHKLSSLLTTPRHLVYTTDMGHVFVHELLPAEAAR